jgi:preprotein translocase subunit YajC
MLISNAWAQAAAPAAGFDSQIFVLIAMLAVFYFILIRPQMKRAKEHKAMIEALQKGDEVVAAGGIIGKVGKISDGYVALQIAEGVEVQMQRSAVQLVLPKGTIKGIE